MPLFLKTVRSVIKILLATRSRMYEVDKSGNILGTYTLDSYPVHFVIIEGLVTSMPGFYKFANRYGTVGVEVKVSF